MAWSGGLFGRLYSWSADKIAGINILASRMDGECDNFRQGIEDTLHKGGQNSPTANLPMAGFRHTGVGVATARDQYAATSQVQDGTLSWVVAGGSADNITATYVPPIPALVNGMELKVRASTSNAGSAPVFSPSGLSAYPITKFGGQALSPGDIYGAGHELILKLDLANTRWELLNPGKALAISNDVVGFAQMANLATDRLIGRDTAGTGDPESIALDATLEFTGAGTIRRAALTGDVTASAGSNTMTLATSGVTAATYGSATQVPQVTFDAKGRATGAGNVSIQIAESQVTNLVSDLAAKQPLDAELTALAGLVSAADQLPYFTGAGTASLTTLSAFARTLIDDVDASTMRSTLGLVIGTNVQAFDAELAALAGLTSAADALPYFTGSGTASTTTLSSFMRTVLDDASAASAAATLSVLPLSGGTLTGALTLAGDAASALQATTLQQVQAIAGTGLNVHPSVTLATTANITLSGEQTIDGVLTSSTRILVKDQTTAAQNGPYITSAGAWTRATDADTAAENSKGSYYFVNSGTTNGKTAWYQTSNTVVTLGTDAITFQQFSAAQTYTASNGVVLSGSNFSGVVANTARLTVGASGFDLATTAVGAGSYGSASAVATFTVDAYGRLTAAGNSSIAIAESQVTNLVSDLAAKQPLDSELTALAGLVSAADQVPYFTGSGTAALASFTSFGRTLVSSAAASNARSSLGLVIGTDVQAQDSELSAIAGLVSAADMLPYFTGAGTASLATYTAFARTLDDDPDAATARSTLGLVIGTNVQAFDGTLNALAGLTITADSLTIGTGADAFTQTAFGANTFPAKSSAGALTAKTITDFGLSLVDDADATTARSTLGLVIGSNVQAYDAELAAIAGLTSAADLVPLFTGSGTATTMSVTAAARTVLDDASVSAMLSTLGGLALAGGTMTGDLVLSSAGPGSVYSAGFRGVPQNIQNGNYTFVLADAGNHVIHTSATAGHVYTIPANASVAFPIGTAITIVNTNGSASISVAITTDTLRRGDGTAGTGTRTVGADRICTIIKTAATEWYISGSFS